MSKGTIIAVFAVAVLASGGALALWLDGGDFNGSGSEETTESNEVSDDRLQELDEEKHRRLDEEDSENDSGDSNDDEQDEDSTREEQEETEDEEKEYEASIVLNNFGQRDSGKVYANATVDDTTEGTCEFRFSHGDSSVTKTAPVERTPTGYYACGVGAEAAEFSPKGEWTARAYLQDTDPQVRSEQRNAEIQ